MPAVCSIAVFPANTIMSATEAPHSAAIFSYIGSTSFSCAGLFASQLLWGSRRIRAPFAPPRISEPLKVAALAQAVSIMV